MPIAVTEEHESLRRTAQRWLESHSPPTEPRALAEAVSSPADTPRSSELPPVWEKMAAQGWLGLHLAEEDGGQGFTLAEVAVVLEELGASLFPGPVLPTLLVSAALARHADAETRRRLLPGLADGSLTAAVALGSPADADRAGDGSIVLRGAIRPVLGLPPAELVLVPLAGSAQWCLLDRSVLGDALVPEALPALDPTRTVGALEFAGGELTLPPAAQVLVPDENVRSLALVLAAAESAGLARWCLETASDYAKVRVQFGRPIGQFQAVKHALADMLVAVEQCAAVAWDAATAWDEPAEDQSRHLSARIAGAIALPGAAHCAKQCIQILGGIGFTWEHDAHLYLKRAMANLQLVTGGDVGAIEFDVAARAVAGARRNLAADLPEEAESLRAAVRKVVDDVAAAGADDPSGLAQRAAMAEAGLISPHWPAPWGRGASPLEQLVIDEEMAAAGVMRPHLAVGAWALPTIIAYGTEEQQERWVRPTLLGQLNWCQLFSEPGAGSDLAGLSTRADRVEGGYVLNGQKVWTSLAQTADFGICLARSDPDAPKHAGITYFIVDMRTEGLDIRPLRELTGAAMFNEVFFNDVFVPDDCVIGTPGDGWRIGRTTLANERVSMSSGASFGNGVESLIRTMARRAERGDPLPSSLEERLGHLIAEAQSVALLGHRSTLRTLSGVDPGSGSSVRKLLGVEHEQRVQEMGMALYAADGAVLDGKAQRWEEGFLSTRCLTIAGGTSEVQRNVIAERMLGQPKDPEPGS
ncbi:MAG TPA: acyl-CoA dehydrogenase [Acidimicrobiales bacterium]|jgi:alkylation response protein AidB-like acyl-CoA dehydrogenase|nr:acyl-CoA dehydrogenase [Acidimicrobiales bacterium]